MQSKRILFNYLLVAILFLGVFFVGVSVGKHQTVCKVCRPENLDFSLFWEAYDKLHDNFINPETISDQEVMYGAISGMVKSLDDPYTTFFNPKDAKMFEQDLAGSFEGIGVEVGIKKEQLTVISPLKGSPGEKAGLRAGDQIIEINGKSTFDISIDEAVNSIRGKGGTQVTLTIFREGWKDTKEITIVRDTIKIDSVDWELKDGNVAYINIRQFGETLSADFKKIAFEMLASPAKKIVLDLRNNPGGYLEVSQDIAGWFLQDGSVITIEDFGKTKEPKEYKAQGNASLITYPTVVLMNNGSASASEILAGALRDNRGIKLIGEKSFGKGSVQIVIGLEDDSLLKITAAKWLTPKGSSIAEVGLEPDIKIQMREDDVELKKDAQLEKALEVIKTLE